MNRKQPFGSGATCVYNYCDLQIYNNTDMSYQLNIHLDDKYLNGQWRSNEEIQNNYVIYEKNHFIKQEYWGGYTRHNEIYRKVLNKKGEQISDEFISKNDAIMMYSPLLKE